MQATVEATVRTGEPYAIDFRIIRPDGDVRLVHNRGALLRDGSGRPARVLGTVQDVTDRKRAENERAAHRERQARLDGMLYAARELASQVNKNLVASSGAIGMVQSQAIIPPHLREAIDAATTALSEATRAMAELQRLIPPAAQEQPSVS